jgi:outer membrane receptor protein involved in Fe transport
MLLTVSTALADTGGLVSYVGQPLISVIEEFRLMGVDFAYSTNVVTSDLHVAFEPQPGTPLEIMQQILTPLGLAVRSEAGTYIIVRNDPVGLAPTTAPTQESRRVAPGIETVIVAASRYEISRDVTTSRYSLDQRSIQNMPDMGEDPLRSAQKLPGAAASGASARTHFRGGEENEVGIILNGQWLFDPFHIRDYQNIFSAIDARAIDGVEVYTGGFPARYGDRMSGLVLMDSLNTEKSSHTEIGISVFNTSFLTAGENKDRSWLFSARRGNLDLIINPKFGKPSYFDVFGEYAFELSPGMQFSMNALYADDKVDLVLETDPAERERVVSNTQNAQVWFRLDSEWSSTLASSTVLALVDFANRRTGEINDPEKMIAAVQDDRDISQVSLRQDWVWSPSSRHRAQWGINMTFSDADLSYAGTAEFFGLQALYENQPPSADRRIVANPEGGNYAMYVSDRWKLSDRAVVEWGLRWDDQTYTDFGSDSQLSPRFNLLYRTSENTELRLSAGRYHQSQPIQSLQVEDGIMNYWPAQRGDHLIAGLRYLTPNDTALRIETFLKDMRRVRPRFENLYNPLGVLPELQADRVRIEPTMARAYGIEVSADRSVGHWNWWASYALSEATDRIDGRDVPRSWDQRHAFQGGFGWHSDVWDLSVAGSVHSGWPTTGLSLDPDGAAVPGMRNAERLSNFASLDFRLSRSFELRRGSLLVFIEVSNALNRQNVCCVDWDIEEDDAGNVTLESSLDYWMPLLPAIGVLWEF